MKKTAGHVAIIMDGNGRWANNRRHRRWWGHIRGASIVSDIVQAADDRRIGALTLYSFSTENWSRPKDEVVTLFKLLRKFLIKERNRIIQNGINFKVIGDYSRLPAATTDLIKELEAETKNNKGLKLRFAFGYGARSEIINVLNKFQEMHPEKKITQDDVENLLETHDVGDVDILIRTGGDYRISNFLLWQIAYAELYFSNTLWPDFTVAEFNHILDEVAARDRRFGYVEAISDIRESQKRASLNLSSFDNY